MDSHRDHLIRTLLRSNERRAAWPLSSIIPLMVTIGLPASYVEFHTIVATTDWLDHDTRAAAKALSREAFTEYELMAIA